MVQETGIEVPRDTQVETEEWDSFNRARNGDEKAWRILMTKYRVRLSALALLITGSGCAAEDIVQETFVRALDAKIKDRSGTVHGFLGTIAYRLAVKEARRSRRNVDLHVQALTDDGDSPIQLVLNNERDRAVAEAIHSLNQEHRDTLLLRYYGGHSYEEIADLLDVPIGTVKSRIFYAVKSCRDMLRRKGVFD